MSFSISPIFSPIFEWKIKDEQILNLFPYILLLGLFRKDKFIILTYM